MKDICISLNKQTTEDLMQALNHEIAMMQSRVTVLHGHLTVQVLGGAPYDETARIIYEIENRIIALDYLRTAIYKNPEYQDGELGENYDVILLKPDSSPYGPVYHSVGAKML